MPQAQGALEDERRAQERSLKIRGRGNNPRSCEQILGLAHAKNYTLSRHH